VPSVEQPPNATTRSEAAEAESREQGGEVAGSMGESSGGTEIVVGEEDIGRSRPAQSRLKIEMIRFQWSSIFP